MYGRLAEAEAPCEGRVLKERMHNCTNGGVCPFFDRNDRRCAERFTLLRMAEVFDHCLGRYTECPVYHQISCPNKIENRTHAVVIAR